MDFSSTDSDDRDSNSSDFYIPGTSGEDYESDDLSKIINIDEKSPNILPASPIMYSTLDGNNDEAYVDNNEVVPTSSGQSSLTMEQKKKRKKHNCPYCDVFVDNFARHLERQQNDELQVQQFLALKKSDPKRKQFINKIRKEGDFSCGGVIPVQGKQKIRSENLNKETCTLLPCIHCKGYYARKTLCRHVKRCFFNKTHGGANKPKHQSEGHTLMADYFGPNDPLRVSGVLKTLSADISLVAKRDKIICEIGRRYVKRHKEKHLVQVARRKMRRLARLLIEARKIESNNSLALVSLLHPSKFKVIIQATKSVSQYDVTKKSFNSPSLALQMGTLIKLAINTAYSLELQIDIDSPKLKIFDIMKKLIEEEWAVEISTEAGQNLTINRFNKPTIIPMAQDISRMKDYLDKLILNSKTKLQENNQDEVAFKQLIEGTYCSLLLFNKRQVGELQRIPLDIYMKHQNNKPSGEFEKLLSPSERILIKRLKRIVIRGKRGRGVPVLFDKTTQEGVDMAIQYRNNFFMAYNQYLFGLSRSESCISGYHVFRKHVRLALGDPNKTVSLTSSKLRKHLATITQILKMEHGDLEQLATFMGHTTKTHNEWYKLPSDIYQTAKVSKILLLAQNNCIDKYKGRNLNELDLEDKLIETESDSEKEIQNGPLYQNTCESLEKNKNINLDIQINKKKIIRKAWSTEEKNITELYFKNHIKNKVPPKKEVRKLMESNREVFKERGWQSIKVYVCNQYGKNKI